MTQQAPNPQPDDVGRHEGVNKRARPFVIESRYRPFHGGPWGPWKRYKAYRTEDERTRALENLQRKAPVLPGRPRWLQYRNAPDAP